PPQHLATSSFLRAPPRPPHPPLFPYTTLFRSICPHVGAAPPGGYVCVPMMAQGETLGLLHLQAGSPEGPGSGISGDARQRLAVQDRKSTRLNSSHLGISYAVFCLKKKNTHHVH